MALEAGTKLGPYEILSPLGAGGMGEVYRAKDSRLDREVAIKVLPSHLTANREFKQRFEREAKSISQLSHPNICTLHDIGNEDGVDFLVMELLEGETLAQRLSKGQLAIDEVLRLGIEIASALDKAHRAGIVHRDLKPGNIILTNSGAKLLDFGLAKTAPGHSGLSTAPDAVTISEPLTSKGTIVGTFQYMAPEQLEGKDADHRTDIFSFGTVLYEMVTGKRAFEGSSRASLIASIMSAQPRAISELLPVMPPALDFMVRSCLAKNPDDRIQTAHDAALNLRWIQEGGSRLGLSAATSSHRRIKERIKWTLAIIVCVFSAAVSVWSVRSNRGLHVHRMNVLPPENSMLVPVDGNAGPVVLSPDGTRMAFAARTGEGRQRIWVRSLDAFDAVPLAGTEGAARMFWSPDGRKLGFFANEKLLTVDADGGPTRVLTDAPDSRGGTWNRDDTIIFAPRWNSGLSRVSAAGGSLQVVTEIDEASGENTHRYPCFLPDGDHFLYLARRSGAGAGLKPEIRLASLSSPGHRTLLAEASSIAYASGHILFARQRTLMAIRFDADQLEIVGDAFPIATDLMVDERFSLGVFTASQNGIVAYQTGEASSLTQLKWLDRSGERIGVVGNPENYNNNSSAELSPDETQVLFSVQDRETGLADVWVRNLTRDMQVRLTFGHLDAQRADSSGAVWSPDGDQIAYGRLRGRFNDLIQKNASGVGAAETLAEAPGGFAQPCSYSSDGKFLLFEPDFDDAGDDLWVLSLDENRESKPFANSPANEVLGQFAPDGKFVAFASDISGQNEVYIASFPDRVGEWQVSTNGGTEPRWRRDGKELYFFDSDNWLNATEVQTTGSNLELGKTKKLFQTRRIGARWRYDPAADGERFLVLTPSSDEAPSTIHVVVNWLAERGN